MQIRNWVFITQKPYANFFFFFWLREHFILGTGGPSPYLSPILAILLPISHLFEGSEGQVDQFDQWNLRWSLQSLRKESPLYGKKIIIIPTFKIFVPASHFLLTTLSVRIWYLELWPLSWRPWRKTENIREEGRQETGFCRTLLWRNPETTYLSYWVNSRYNQICKKLLVGFSESYIQDDKGAEKWGARV